MQTSKLHISIGNDLHLKSKTADIEAEYDIFDSHIDHVQHLTIRARMALYKVIPFFIAVHRLGINIVNQIRLIFEFIDARGRGTAVVGYIIVEIFTLNWGGVLHLGAC